MQRTIPSSDLHNSCMKALQAWCTGKHIACEPCVRPLSLLLSVWRTCTACFAEVQKQGVPEAWLLAILALHPDRAHRDVRRLRSCQRRQLRPTLWPAALPALHHQKACPQPGHPTLAAVAHVACGLGRGPGTGWTHTAQPLPLRSAQPAASEGDARLEQHLRRRAQQPCRSARRAGTLCLTWVATRCHTRLGWSVSSHFPAQTLSHKRLPKGPHCGAPVRRSYLSLAAKWVPAHAVRQARVLCAAKAAESPAAAMRHLHVGTAAVILQEARQVLVL